MINDYNFYQVKENENDDGNQDKDQNEKTDTENTLDQADLIEKTGEVIPQNAKYLIHCLTIIGQVEGIMSCRHKIKRPNMNMNSLPCCN